MISEFFDLQGAIHTPNHVITNKKHDNYRYRLFVQSACAWFHTFLHKKIRCTLYEIIFILCCTFGPPFKTCCLATRDTKEAHGGTIRLMGYS